MSVLDIIIEKKKYRVSSSKSRKPLSELKAITKDIEKPRDFKKALHRARENIKLIAEIKKASPSNGLIRKNFNHLEIASIYENKRVDAISVLTEEDFFQGNLSFLSEVKQSVNMPVLRKDFIVDVYQIYEAYAYSADAILLIATILEKSQAQDYLSISDELGMSVLFEVHDMDELDVALSIKAPVIGINNRNLKTMSINLNTSLELKKGIPKDRIVVTESGIRTRKDVLLVQQAGLDAMLIGTSFMKSGDISAKIDELRGKT